MLVTLGSLACQTTGVRVPDPKAVLASPCQSPSYMCGLTNARRNTRNCLALFLCMALAPRGVRIELRAGRSHVSLEMSAHRSPRSDLGPSVSYRHRKPRTHHTVLLILKLLFWEDASTCIYTYSPCFVPRYGLCWDSQRIGFGFLCLMNTYLLKLAHHVSSTILSEMLWRELIFLHSLGNSIYWIL